MKLTVARRAMNSVVLAACLVATACSGSATQADERVFGIIGACSPAPIENTEFYYSVGGFELDQGDVLTVRDIAANSSTGFDGNVDFALLDIEQFESGTGLQYDDSLGFRELPKTVSGPSTFQLVLIVELTPANHSVVFSDVEFALNGLEFVSFEGDTFEFEIMEGGC